MHALTFAAGSTRAPRRRLSAVRLAVVLVIASGAILSPASLALEARATESPNIVLIVTDDQRFDELAPVQLPSGPALPMPTVTHELVEKGIEFSNAFVSNPLCCPSRTSILTGRYSHSTGVYSNGGPHGGFAAFQPQEDSTIATWLQSAGYTTGLFGKYLNGYRDPGQAGYVPPGWDRWVGIAENSSSRFYYDYNLNIDGRVAYHGTAPNDYSTDVLADEASRFIRSSKGPLFMYFAPVAPHGPATPAPRHAGSFAGATPLRPENYDEANVSDKPAWVRALPRITAERTATIDRTRERRLETLRSVDDAVAEILSALDATGRLHNTMVVFMSDNGLSLGEHRWVGKLAPYEESVRVPLVIRYDPLTVVPRTDSHIVLNIDLTPTFAALAGGAAPGVDGTSLVPLLTVPGLPWRSDFLIEHLGSVSRRPTYCGVRTDRYTYVVYETGEEELFELAQDPAQMRNVVNAPAYASVRRALLSRLRGLCDPEPPDPDFSLARASTGHA